MLVVLIFVVLFVEFTIRVNLCCRHETKEAKLKLSEIYLNLGEIGLESGKFMTLLTLNKDITIVYLSRFTTKKAMQY